MKQYIANHLLSLPCGLFTDKFQDGLTHAFVIQFENHNDRDYYVQHDPVHKAFKKEIEPIIEKVTVLDFINGEF